MRSAGVGELDEKKIAETTETKSVHRHDLQYHPPPAPPRAPSPRTCHPTPCEHDAAFSAERIAKTEFCEKFNGGAMERGERDGHGGVR